MGRQLVIVGAGGFGREALMLVRDLAGTADEVDFLGFLDDSIPDPSQLGRIGADHLGPREAMADLPASVTFIVGIGQGAIRREIAEELVGWGYEPAVLVHPSAFVGADVRLAPGTVVAAGAAVTTNVDAGPFLHVDRGAQVGHDCSIGGYVTINPMATVSGAVRLGDEVNLGTNCTVLPGITIADRVVVGGGTVVVKDLTVAGDVVAGVPARSLAHRSQRVGYPRGR